MGIQMLIYMLICFLDIIGNLINERIPYTIIWQYSAEKWGNAKYHYSNEKHGELKAKLSNKIYALMNEAY
jgi:hypothetical protein